FSFQYEQGDGKILSEKGEEVGNADSIDELMMEVENITDYNMYMAAAAAMAAANQPIVEVDAGGDTST
ncbi:hypothetical protein DFQ30_002987, partial [Apophysomyces sp. BC1015]